MQKGIALLTVRWTSSWLPISFNMTYGRTLFCWVMHPENIYDTYKIRLYERNTKTNVYCWVGLIFLSFINDSIILVGDDTEFWIRSWQTRVTVNTLLELALQLISLWVQFSSEELGVEGIPSFCATFLLSFYRLMHHVSYCCLLLVFSAIICIIIIY